MFQRKDCQNNDSKVAKKDGKIPKNASSSTIFSNKDGHIRSQPFHTQNRGPNQQPLDRKDTSTHQIRHVARQESFGSQMSQNSQNSRPIRYKDPVLENTSIPIDHNSKEKHFKVMLQGNMEVFFPYQPYQVQLTYMESVMKCLSNKQNGLLESPTGTGKTLSLLCASLAWLKKRRELSLDSYQSDGVPNRIIYCSRTHSQIQQAVKELKRTIYQPKVVVQGSREQYCIKKEFEALKGGILNAACQKAINPGNMQNHCRFFKVSDSEETRDLSRLRIPDIEDLRIDGYNHNYCPYFQTQRISNAVDLLFLPYNYLLDRNVRSQSDILIKNAIIIFDEAHNIHKVAEEGFSLVLNYQTLCAAENDLQHLAKCIDRGYFEDGWAPTSNISSQPTQHRTPVKALSDFDRKNFNSCSFDCQAMLKPICELKKFFRSKIPSNDNTSGQQLEVKEGKDIFEWIQIHTRSESDRVQLETLQMYTQILQKEKGETHNSFESGINFANISMYIEKTSLALKDLSMGTSHHGLEIFTEFLEGLHDLWINHTLFTNKSRRTENDSSRHFGDSSSTNLDVMKDYKLYFDLDDRDNPQLNLACLNASLNFNKLLAKQPHCLIFTSGTLKPFDFWKSELQIPFQVVLENNHVIDSQKQLFAAVIKTRPSQGLTRTLPSFNFSYERRKDQDMILGLGLALIELLSIIPSGVLVVFPSNQLMDTCKQAWMQTSSSIRIYNRLLEIKNLYWECRSNQENQVAVTEYKLKSKTERGSVIFCVARGKITEGIDFSDEFARAVILVGLPYPPLKNIKIQVKRDYLNELKKTNTERISGNEWYTQEAVRAMNQSIGRVIRHIKDWGSILFLDERFTQPEIIGSMPSWCKTQQIETFDEALRKTAAFFQLQRKQQGEKQEEYKRKLHDKMKRQEEEQKREQTFSGSDMNGNAGQSQKRVFNFQKDKMEQKQKKFVRQNVLLSDVQSIKQTESQESIADSIGNQQNFMLSDEESDQLILTTSSLIKKPTNSIQYAILSNPLNKQPSQTNISGFFDVRLSKSTDSSSNNTHQKPDTTNSIAKTSSSIMNMKNSIYSNKKFYEF